MTYRPKYARVNPQHPQAWATCDQCGFQHNLVDLHWEKQWAGQNLIKNGFLVCERCVDPPAPFLKTLILPPDPKPVMNARVEPYDIDEARS